MNLFKEAAEWVCQNPVDDVIIAALAISGTKLALMARKDHLDQYAESRRIAEKWANRPDNSPKLPPRTPRR